MWQVSVSTDKKRQWRHRVVLLLTSIARHQIAVRFGWPVAIDCESATCFPLTSPVRFEPGSQLSFRLSPSYAEPFFSRFTPPLHDHERRRSRSFFRRSESGSTTSTRVWRSIQSNFTLRQADQTQIYLWREKLYSWNLVCEPYRKTREDYQKSVWTVNILITLHCKLRFTVSAGES